MSLCKVVFNKCRDVHRPGNLITRGAAKFSYLVRDVARSDETASSLTRSQVCRTAGWFERSAFSAQGETNFCAASLRVGAQRARLGRTDSACGPVAVHVGLRSYELLRGFVAMRFRSTSALRVVLFVNM
jgi:hypothetical protein